MMKFIIIYLCSLIMVGSCAKKNESPADKTVATTLTLPMDSRLSIIMATTGLLSATCVPDCWPRSFTAKMPPVQYIAYLMQKTPNLIDSKEFDPERLIKSEPTINSSFYPLIRQLAKIKAQKLTVDDTKPLWNKRVKIGIINRLKNLNDNELGYLDVLPVVTNKTGDKAVFVYELTGASGASWFVCARKTANKWLVVNESRLATYN